MAIASVSRDRGDDATQRYACPLPSFRKDKRTLRNPVTDSIVGLLVLMVLFGPKRLPALGRTLGQGIRGFRRSITRRGSDAEGESRALIPARTSEPGLGSVES